MTANLRRYLVPLAALVSPRTWAAAGYVATGAVLGVVTFVLAVVLLALGVGLAPLAGVGLLAAGLLLYLARGVGAFERGRLAATLGERVPAPVYPPPRSPGWRGRLAALLRSRARWRAVGYMVALLPAAVLGSCFLTAFWAGGLVGTSLPIWVGHLPDESNVQIFGDMGDGVRQWLAFAAGLLALLLAPWVTRAAGWLCACLPRLLLGPSGQQELTERVQALQDTRERIVDAADAERRRIERDLHDGAQQRLVALAVDLGRARARLEADPTAAPQTRRMIADAHEEAKQTLAELRDLVRGIHPAVLSDRGLDAALSALAARSPVPVQVESSLAGAGRCAPPAEAVAYFVVAEALTNVAKHARADHAVVRADRAGGELVVSITDDGVGGADPAGVGLRGLADRARAVDGELTVHSPAGGPTTVTVRVPCR